MLKLEKSKKFSQINADGRRRGTPSKIPSSGGVGVGSLKIPSSGGVGVGKTV
ncbi:MAG: hypothetical protein JW755_14500 [Candidatus Aminicenantes bacterium]|nr:hypothetical protein [Candidatus Aminicenantes bacterium]